MYIVFSKIDLKNIRKRIKKGFKLNKFKYRKYLNYIMKGEKFLYELEKLKVSQ